MADFAAVLRKTLDRIDQPSPEMRANVYQKARDAIARQIDAMETRPPQAAIDKQYAKLEDAIAEIEANYVPEPEPEVSEPEPEPVVEEPVEEITPEPEPEAEPEPEPEPEPVVEEVSEPEPVIEEEPVVPDVSMTGRADPVADMPDEENPPEVEPLDDTLEGVPADDDGDAPVFDTAEAVDDDQPEVIDPEVAAQDDPVAEALADYNDADAIAEEVAAAPDTEEERDPLLDFLNEQTAANEADRVSADEPTIDVGESGVTSQTDGEPVLVGDASDRSDIRAEPIAAPVRSGGGGKAIIWLLVLALLGGLGYAGFTYQNQIKSWFSSMTGGNEAPVEDAGVPVRTVPSTTVTPDSAETETPAESGEQQAALETENAVDNPGAVDKFTQRLTEDGSEIDEGPVEGATTEAEGSSVFAQNGQVDGEEPAATDADAAGNDTTDTQTPATEQPLPVGQRAIFYEERTGSQAGTALAGAVVWSITQESPASGLEPEPTIHAEASIPELNLVMEMNIKRNGDETLPASHLVELFFRVPDTFEGRGIADVQRVTLKEAESDAGNALIAVPAPLDTNIFMIALTDADTAIESNLRLLETQNWIDIPMQYISGRRALITLEKGIPGDKVFKDVIEAWKANPLTSQ